MSADRPHVVVGEVERRPDGEVWLHLIRDEQVVHIDQHGEYLTVALKVNPWIPVVFDE